MVSELPAALSPSDQKQLQLPSLAMYAQTTRPLYVLFVFSVLALLSLLSLFAFVRLHLQRQRRIADSTPKLRFRRHHRLWILAAGTNRRPPGAAESEQCPRGMVELETIVSSGSNFESDGRRPIR
ncbi:hypothetical protein GPALN_011280 [Globodera pallida]|nr:hypothetical protein GPALN_011280 [Globodera pallida]